MYQLHESLENSAQDFPKELQPAASALDPNESLDQFGYSAILQFHSFSYPKKSSEAEFKSELQLAPLSNVYDMRWKIAEPWLLPSSVKFSQLFARNCPFLETRLGQSYSSIKLLKTSSIISHSASESSGIGCRSPSVPH